ncbi:TPA: hypothetical protein DEB72_00835 [Patescibacteria group bacterium]|nr:hypothetical protein [Patescibacteria group bacterium]
MKINFSHIITHILRWQFVRFSISGAVATALDVSVLYLLTEWGQVWYLFSAGISFVLGSFTHYLISHLWVFKSPAENKARKFLSFFIIHASNLGFSLILLYVLVEYAGLWYILAKLLTVAVTVMINFTLQKKITFKYSTAI